MQLLWKRFVMPRRSETWLVLTIAVLLFAFGLVAQEVSEGEPFQLSWSFYRARSCARQRSGLDSEWLAANLMPL
jgi:hypothetical protein